MEMRERKDWEPAEKMFLQLVKEQPILYNSGAPVRNKSGRTTFCSAPQIWNDISEKMCKSGHSIKPKSCRDKFIRIWKQFKKIYKISKVDKSVLCSRYLNGTLSFLEKEVEKQIIYDANTNCLQDKARLEKSSDSVTGFAAISLPSSNSESESNISNLKQNNVTEMTSSTNFPWVESKKKVFNPTETTVSKTIVTIEMIEALLKSKIDSSNAKTGGSIFPDDASDTTANLSRILPTFVDQSNVDKAVVASPTSSVMMSTDSTTSPQVNTINSTDISEVEITTYTAPKNRDFRDASTVDKVKKEVTSIFDINSEEGDIEVFLNEVADFMSNSYSFERQMDIRSKISDLVASAEKEEIDQQSEETDQQANPCSSNIITHENLALEQLAGIKYTLATQSHVYDVYDLGSDSDS